MKQNTQFEQDKIDSTERKMIPPDTMDAIKNLYESNIDVEFIAMQVDLDIPTVISVLKELGIYREK